MTPKRVVFSVLCVLLVVVIVMTGIIIGKVSQMLQTLTNPGTKPQDSTVQTTQPGTTSPTQPSVVVPAVPENTVVTEPGHVHEYELTETVEASCENYGYSIYTCSGCGKQDIPFEEQVEPYGHNFGAGQVIAATCTENGCTRYTCSRCGKTEDHNVQTAPGHMFAYVLTVTGRCDTVGYDLYRCSVCGEEEHRNEVAQGEHSYNVISREEPTCDTDGFELKKCTICGEETTTVLPSNGHEYGEWILCDDDSLIRYCLGCGMEQATADLVITKTQVSVSGIGGESIKVYIICVGSSAEPEIFRYTLYDSLDNGTLAYEYDAASGLVVTYVNGSGETVTKELYFFWSAPYVIS